MVPPAGAYYVYDGSTVIPPCAPTEWVVFKSMINIDPTDFAFLVKNVQPGSRGVQALANREIFFNDVAALPGGPMPHDNKTYMRCRPTGKKAKTIPVQKVDLKTSEAKQREEDAKNNDPNTLTGHIKSQLSKYQYEDILMYVLSFLLISLGLYGGYSMFNSSPQTYNIFEKVRGFTAYIRNYLLEMIGYSINPESSVS
jgi:hypothetical protein